MRRLVAAVGLIAVLLHPGCREAIEVRSEAGGRKSDWIAYGNDHGGSRHAPIGDITRHNVSSLKVAWTYRTGDISDGKATWHGQTLRTRSGFEATPLVVEGTMYVATPFNRIAALDAETGQQRWVYDPKIERSGDYGDGFVCRGVAYWMDRAAAPQTACRSRIFMATQDSRLVAVDAANGKTCADFGSNGEVRLTDGVKVMYRGEYHMTSPPAVVRDTVVVGSAINDNNRVDMPTGAVRGYDVRSGKMLWTWDPVPRDPADPARKTWQDDSADRTGAANAWGPLSADPERDMVFIPTGSPSPDFYGGERKGANLYANSVVALRGSTGKVIWAFQTVHHDLWDYDVPAQPTLLTVHKGGKTIPAVAQATKMGHLFVLNRETGEPLQPVEERPVPQNPVAGEWVSPTQPFPVATPPLAANRLRPEDAWGITFWDRGACRDKIASLRNEGIFTPPSLQGTLMYPGNAGGTNWGGLSVDPKRNLMVMNQSNLPFEVKLVPREQAATERKSNPKPEYGAQRGTPYAMRRSMVMSPLGLPCSPPPWGTLAAVDISTGKIRWQVTLGTTRDLAPLGIAMKWGTPNIGGPVTTAGGVTFIAATLDNYLRAFDTETGEELWKGRLPAGSQATPMSYRSRDGGKQYVVIAAGGHAKLDNKLGDYVVAFALP